MMIPLQEVAVQRLCASALFEWTFFVNIEFRQIARRWEITAASVLGLLAACSQSDRGDHLHASQWARSLNATHVDRRMPNLASKVISFDTTEGTFMNVDVSPDGQTLTFDLLGDIYQLPIEGGNAVASTTGRAWDQAPVFSPDGQFIHFVSDRTGTNKIWQLTRSDASVEQLSASDAEIMGTLNWSQDGRGLIAGIRDPNGLEIIPHSFDPISKTMTPLYAPSGPAYDYIAMERLRPFVRVFSAVQSSDGQLYFDEAQWDTALEHMVSRVYTVDIETQTRNDTTLSNTSYNEYKPQLSHDGTRVAYFRQYGDRRTEIRILDRQTRQDKAVVELADAASPSYGARQESRPNYAFTPDDQQLVFWHDGKIHRVDITTGSSEVIPFQATVEREVWERAQPTVQKIVEGESAKAIRWPSVSRDGQTIAFTAIGYVWVMDLREGRVRRLTNSTDLEYMPAISPDGMSIAYVSFAQTGNRYGSGRLMVMQLDGGTPRELLAAPKETYLLPQWSPDGQKIAAIREVEGTTSTKATFGWTPAVHGIFREVAEAPASHLFISAPVYARYVGFDVAGENLLFSYPVSKTEIYLATARLDGEHWRMLAFGSAEVGGIVPAPGLKNLALTRRNGTVWVVPFDAGAEPMEVSTMTSNASRVGNGGAYYVGWNGPEQITYGFAQDIYRFHLHRNGAESVHIELALEIPEAAQSIVLRGARLLTMADGDGVGRVIESGTVVLDGNRISAICLSNDVTIRSDAVVIDVAGKTIMPGLLDTHYHRIGGFSDGMSGMRLPNSDFSDRTAIGYGITTAWEPGGVWDDAAPAMADLQKSGRIAGPRWSHSAMGAVGSPWTLLVSYTDALKAVERHKALGVDVLKEAGTPKRLQQQWLSAAAHENRLGIVSHIDDFDGMMTRIVDGYTGGDHSYIPVPFFKDVHELMRQTGYIWTPNISISIGTLGSLHDVKTYYWQHILEERPMELEKLQAMTSLDYPDETAITQPSVPYNIHRVRRVAGQAAAAAKNGVHVGVSAHNMPGVLLHAEMWYLRKGGLPIADVLRAATYRNAEKLGLQEEIGSLEVGKIADLLVLNENPLEDITNTLSIAYTVQGGVVYDSDTATKTDLTSFRSANRRKAPISVGDRHKGWQRAVD